MSKSNEYLRKWREIQQTNNLLQRPEIYRSQKRKKPRFAARPYEYWCPDSESNQGHGDFQSLQKRPNALSALTVFYWFALRKMFKFAAI
ncbi:hypothetical protein ACNSOB_23090 [Citrobacter braakii]|uniref:hypothetical protein n=1 Tax=Citrobacter braakii TaxID=57706 RepID=UPI003AB341A7